MELKKPSPRSPRSPNGKKQRKYVFFQAKGGEGKVKAVITSELILQCLTAFHLYILLFLRYTLQGGVLHQTLKCGDCYGY